MLDKKNIDTVKAIVHCSTLLTALRLDHGVGA